MFKNNIQDNHQVIGRNILGRFTNYLTMLRQLAHQMISGFSQPQTISKKLNNIVTVIEKNIIQLINSKGDPQNDDYVVEFYEHHIKSLKNQIQKLKLQQSVHSQNLTQLDINTISIRQLKEDLTINTFKINNFSQIIKLRQQIEHSRVLIMENQAFIKQQNSIIQSLKLYVKEVQNKQTKSRTKIDEKIKKFDEQINKNTLLFSDSINHLTQERIKLERQIKELQFLNLKYIQQRDHIDQELVQKNQKIKEMSRKIYDLSLKCISLQRQNSPYQNIEAQQNINILQAEVQALRKKCEFIQKQWESKLQSKIIIIGEIQQKLAELKNQNVTKSDELNLINLKYGRVCERQQNLEKKVSQLTIQCEKLNREYVVMQNKKKFMEYEFKNNEFKIKQFEKMLNENEKYQINSSDRVIKMGQMMTSLKNNHEKEKNQIKEEIFMELENLMKLNKNLQIKNKTIQQEKKQLFLKNQRLEEQKMMREVILKKIGLQNKSLLDKLEQQSNQKYKLQNINEELVKQLESIKKPIQHFNKEDSLSCFQNSQQLLNLQNILMKKDQSIEKKQKEIDKLTMENKTLKQKIKTPISGNFEEVESEIVKLQKQLNRKDFEIKQLESKLRIVQQELRQSEKLNSLQKTRMNNKIKQLQQLLSDRYSFSSR